MHSVFSWCSNWGKKFLKYMRFVGAALFSSQNTFLGPGATFINCTCESGAWQPLCTIQQHKLTWTNPNPCSSVKLVLKWSRHRWNLWETHLCIMHCIAARFLYCCSTSDTVMFTVKHIHIVTSGCFILNLALYTKSVIFFTWALITLRIGAVTYLRLAVCWLFVIQWFILRTRVNKMVQSKFHRWFYSSSWTRGKKMWTKMTMWKDCQKKVPGNSEINSFEMLQRQLWCRT